MGPRLSAKTAARRQTTPSAGLSAALVPSAASDAPGDRSRRANAIASSENVTASLVALSLHQTIGAAISSHAADAGTRRETAVAAAIRKSRLTAVKAWFGCQPADETIHSAGTANRL